MGQTYVVKVGLKPSKETEKVLAKFIKEYKKADFRLDHFKAIGITPDSIENLLRISIHENGEYESNDIITYQAFFDACYGWEGVMEQMFRTIAPTLSTGSFIMVYPDGEPWKLVVGDDGIYEY